MHTSKKRFMLEFCKDTRSFSHQVANHIYFAGCFMHNMKSVGHDVVAFQRIASAIVCQEKYCQQDEE